MPTLLCDLHVHVRRFSADLGDFEGLTAPDIAGECDGLDVLGLMCHDTSPLDDEIFELQRLVRRPVFAGSEVSAHEENTDEAWHVAVIAKTGSPPGLQLNPTFRDLYHLKEQHPDVKLALFHPGMCVGFAPSAKAIVELIGRHRHLFDAVEAGNGALFFLEKFPVKRAAQMIIAAYEIASRGYNVSLIGGSDARNPGEDLPVGSVRTQIVCDTEFAIWDGLSEGATKVQAKRAAGERRLDEIRARAPEAFEAVVSQI